MSVVVGVVDSDGTLHMAADRAVTYGSYQNRVPGIKLFQKGDILFGGVGGLKPIQAIRYNLILPKTKAKDPDVYVIKYLIPQIEKVFLDQPPGVVEVNDPVMPCNLLIGYAGRFYRIGEDLSCVPIEFEYAATGSGEGIAMGVLAAMDGLSPMERMTMAIDITARHDPFVAPDEYDYASL